jgi:hypothetical protein
MMASREVGGGDGLRPVEWRLIINRAFESNRPTLLTDHLGILVVGVVRIAKQPTRLNLELHELVPELTGVSDTEAIRAQARMRGWSC